MMQLKAIFSILLRGFEFELAQPRESYGNDLSKMVVAVRQPCRVRQRRRAGAQAPAGAGARTAGTFAGVGAFGVRVDLDLCQGHGVCAGEAPEVFAVDRAEGKVFLRTASPDAGLRERVELAVRHCPTRALSIEEPSAGPEPQGRR
jgi:sterol 14-demethylase